jgi:hypothetical protein
VIISSLYTFWNYDVEAAKNRFLPLSISEIMPCTLVRYTLVLSITAKEED